jgi:PAS domain S-box-containing protein
MPDTQGLDALAILCGYTAAATSSENSTALDVAAPCNGNTAAVATLSQQQNVDGAVVSLMAQQQQHIQQQQRAQHALQFQQAQQLLTMHRATAAQQQQQLHQQQAANLPSLFVEQAYQIERLLAMQQVQQQLPGNTFGQGLQALAAQLLGAQQMNIGAASLAAFPGKRVRSSLWPSPLYVSLTLSNLALSFVLVSAVPQLASTSPAVPLSLAFHGVSGNSSNNNNNQTSQITSPSSLAMPPPPSKVIPTLPLSNYFAKCTSDTTSADISNSPFKTSPQTKRSKAESKQPPIYDIISEWEDKKQAKRAANRLSAHLSRKRKKIFMDDLKDENSELRRKEQILRSIPDLIVVFDSSGLISFVSHSVTRFMNYTVEELEETSFWDKLTEESVRLIKSAFMDALAVKRSHDEDCTPLVHGESISVTLIQKRCNDNEGTSREDDDRHLLVSLKGVVHFGGEYPECVCSIRPEAVTTLNNNMSPSTMDTLQHNSATTAISRKRQDYESGGPSPVSEAPPSHQVSDIDSEKS